jgi:hypothetical protein
MCVYEQIMLKKATSFALFALEPFLQYVFWKTVVTINGNGHEDSALTVIGRSISGNGTTGLAPALVACACVCASGSVCMLLLR